MAPTTKHAPSTEQTWAHFLKLKALSKRFAKSPNVLTEANNVNKYLDYVSKVVDPNRNAYKGDYATDTELDKFDHTLKRIYSDRVGFTGSSTAMSNLASRTDQLETERSAAQEKSRDVTDKVNSALGLISDAVREINGHVDDCNAQLLPANGTVTGEAAIAAIQLLSMQAHNSVEQLVAGLDKIRDQIASITNRPDSVSQTSWRPAGTPDQASAPSPLRNVATVAAGTALGALLGGLFGAPGLGAAAGLFGSLVSLQQGAFGGGSPWANPAAQFPLSQGQSAAPAFAPAFVEVPRFGFERFGFERFGLGPRGRFVEFRRPVEVLAPVSYGPYGSFVASGPFVPYRVFPVCPSPWYPPPRYVGALEVGALAGLAAYTLSR